jgi:heme-NO-binding protein
VHGVIFSSLRDFVTTAHGPPTAQNLFAGEPVYLLSESYPDEQLAALVRRASALTGLAEDVIVYDFGVFTAQQTFARLYPAFFAIAGSAREFLLTVETRIHELVRATIPNAAPPQLTVKPLGEDGVEILYESPRQLCVLLRGLTEGTAAHFGEAASIDELTCMRAGGDACRFEVRLAARG